MDRISAERRSALMSRIRSKDTGPELIVRRLLHRLGYRYRLHDARLVGRPDIVFASRHKVVFVHGCFWHGHACPRGFKPKANAEFWAAKIDRNKLRDRRAARRLRSLGWRVLTVWECATQPAKVHLLTQRMTRFLDS